jgi:hypothetical protein
MSLSLNDVQIRAFKEGKWELICPRMALKSGTEKIVYKGVGIIRQCPEGNLRFTIIVQKKNVDIANMFRQTSARAGQLVPQNELIYLTAQDNEGRLWKSESPVNYSPTLHAQRQSVTIEGTTSDLVTIINSLKIVGGGTGLVGVDGKPRKQLIHKHPSITYYVCHDLNFPANQSIETTNTVAGKTRPSSWSFSVAKFISCGYDFLITVDKGLTSISVVSQSSRPRHTNPHTAQRIIEAFQFVLTTPIQWSICVICQGNTETIRLQTWLNGVSRHRLLPPFNWCSPDHSTIVWKLFDCYLTFVIKDKKHPIHKLSYRLQSVLQASASSWDTELLTLGVQVEGLIGDHFSNIKLPVKDCISLDAAFSLVSTAKSNHQLDIDQEILDKVRSSLNYLKSNMALRLKSLKGSGVAYKDCIKAWEHIRHKSAHSELELLNVTHDNLDRRLKVISLLYGLVFKIIGYSGDSIIQQLKPSEPIPATPQKSSSTAELVVNSTAETATDRKP